MNRLARLVAPACAFLLFPYAVPHPALAQDEAPPPEPASTQPAPAVDGTTPLMAIVLEVAGTAHHKPLDGDQWQPCAAGDQYPPETVIRTGVRSSVKLQIGEDDTYTAVLIESATKTVISEALRTEDEKRVRIGVGYGRIRAGVAEGGLKSDFTVDSPVATLSKRGTWNFGLFYERGTDRFQIFLLDQGLVDAFNRVTRERRTLSPGQFVRNTMRRWMEEVELVRSVPVVDVLGQSDVEVAFNSLKNQGLGVLGPEGGWNVLINLSSAAAQAQFAQEIRRTQPSMLPPNVVERAARPEGFFGTGRGDQLIPLILESGSPLVQKGFAKPGRYLFRRSALEGWLARHAGR